MMFLSAVIQGQGLRPASCLLRGLTLCPPSGRHGGAGGRLEDRERWGWGVGVRVGAEDESEAVGDAQQVGFPWLSLSTTEKVVMNSQCVLRRCCRHPVRHVRFNTSTLVTANIPDDKSPRGACITDDDLTAHRRSLPFALWTYNKTSQQEEQKYWICSLKRELADQHVAVRCLYHLWKKKP